MIRLIVLFSIFATFSLNSIVRAEMFDNFDEKDNFAFKKNVPYVKDGGERQQLDVFLPKDFKTADAPYPAIVWIHGGGWMSGSKDGMDDIAKAATGFDIAFFSINYRLAPKDHFPAQLEDCKSAIRWIRAHAKQMNVDPKKIGAWGASAGGHLVALLALTGDKKEFDVGEYLDQSSAVQAACDFFGPKDFMILNEYSGYDRFGDVEGLIVGFLGVTLKNAEEPMKKASPLHYVRKNAAPLLILHGTKDEIVPIEQSIDFDRAMKRVGADCRLIVLKGSGHGGAEFLNEKNGREIVAFFFKHLKGITIE